MVAPHPERSPAANFHVRATRKVPFESARFALSNGSPVSTAQPREREGGADLSSRRGSRVLAVPLRRNPAILNRIAPNFLQPGSPDVGAPGALTMKRVSYEGKGVSE